MTNQNKFYMFWILAVGNLLLAALGAHTGNYGSAVFSFGAFILCHSVAKDL
jgi:hypothetical protein